jgi:proline iminopeptidase
MTERLIPINTPAGEFNVWTRSVGDNPRCRLLLLHGGPGSTHEYFTSADRHLPAAGIEYIYYDQLGSAHSDQPDAPELWEVPRFVDEVEQVRRALGLGPESFFLLGHSWGGILAMEYALAHQGPLKGLVISNMMASVPAYNEYAERVLMPEMEPETLAEIKRREAAGETEDDGYLELLLPHYERHLLRRPFAEWPPEVARSLDQINRSIYVPLQGPSELGASGKLEQWDRTADLPRITVPTLVIGARHDTMDPAHMRWMSEQLPHGRYHECPEGTHLAMWDDEETYWRGVVEFLRDVA